jgi:uncharacterized protein YkwD
MLACMVANAACGDGIGMPIRRAVANEGVAGADGDAGMGFEAVPEVCAEVLEGWDQEAADAEDELFGMINELRIGGPRLYCDGLEYGPDPRLTLATPLRCSARLHSIDMATHEFARTEGSDGRSPRERMAAAGFRRGRAEASIVVGEVEPHRVLDRLLDRGEDCSYIRTRGLTHIGIGLFEGRWTIDYAQADDEDEDGR